MRHQPEFELYDRVVLLEARNRGAKLYHPHGTVEEVRWKEAFCYFRVVWDHQQWQDAPVQGEFFHDMGNPKPTRGDFHYKEGLGAPHLRAEEPGERLPSYVSLRTLSSANSWQDLLNKCGIPSWFELLSRAGKS